MLNEQDKKVLDAIIVKDPNFLTDEEAGIIRARRAYLNYDAQVKFKDVLAATPAAPAEQSAPATDEAATDGEGTGEAPVEAAGKKRSRKSK